MLLLTGFSLCLQYTSAFDMKNNRPASFSRLLSGVTVFALFLCSCSTISYVGDRYQPTDRIDVYYAERDVKSEYKVIGHLSELVGGINGEEQAKQNIIAKCREVGADGVIILGFQYSGSDEDKQYQKAQAIKYID